LSKPGKILIIEAIAENIVAFEDYVALKIKKNTEIYTHVTNYDLLNIENQIDEML